MEKKIYIEIDGVRYSADMFIASVSDGIATLAVVGRMPMSFKVEEEPVASKEEVK